MYRFVRFHQIRSNVVNNEHGYVSKSPCALFPALLLKLSVKQTYCSHFIMINRSQEFSSKICYHTFINIIYLE